MRSAVGRFCVFVSVILRLRCCACCWRHCACRRTITAAPRLTGDPRSQKARRASLEQAADGEAKTAVLSPVSAPSVGVLGFVPWCAITVTGHCRRTFKVAYYPVFEERFINAEPFRFNHRRSATIVSARPSCQRYARDTRPLSDSVWWALVGAGWLSRLTFDNARTDIFWRPVRIAAARTPREQEKESGRRVGRVARS